MTVQKLLLAYLAATILVVVAVTGIGQMSSTNSTTQCGLFDGPDSPTHPDLGFDDGPHSPTHPDLGFDGPHSPTHPDYGLDGRDSHHTWTPRYVPGPDQQPSSTSDDSPGYNTIGGVTALNMHQSIVSVQYNGDHRCFGTILTQEHILVPARCLRSIDPRKLKVVYGLTKLGDVCPWTRDVLDFQVNPGWDESGQQWTHDEAVLVVDAPVEIGCHFKAVTLADEGSVFPRDTKGIVYRWGGNGQSELEMVHVKVTDHMQCKHMYHVCTTDDDRVTDDMICASGPDGQDACESDAGSPLMIRNGDGWIQAGFVIRGQEPFLPLVYWKPQKTFIESSIKELAPCGIQNPPCPSCPGGHPFIMGGVDAPPHSWPWMAYVTDDEDYAFRGAVLLNRYYAATYGTWLSKWLVLGAHDFKSNSEDRQWIRIEKVIVHPHFNPNTKSNMITLLKLSRPVQFNKNVAPVCLPNEDDKTPNGHLPCMVTGWGKYRPDMSDHRHDTLQEVHRTPSNRSCGNYDYNTMFCDEPSTDIMHSIGDFGGPLMCRMNDDYIWTLHGVVIGPYDYDRGTHSIQYGRVTGMLSWIKKTIDYTGRQASFKRFDG